MKSSAFAVALLLVFAWTTDDSMSRQKTPSPDPKVVWEAALRAKGGRDNLHAIHNILASDSDSHPYIQLCVPPNRYWSWDDSPEPIGLSIDMANLDKGVAYVLTPSARPQLRRSEDFTAWKGTLFHCQALFLMETAWLQPVPFKAEVGKFDGRLAQFVHVPVPRELFESRAYAYVLDPESKLPRAVFSYDPANPRISRTIRLRDYRAVSGIMLPHQLSFKKGFWVKYEYQINVDYDPGLFEVPPTVEDGPDAWRRAPAAPKKE